MIAALKDTDLQWIDVVVYESFSKLLFKWGCRKFCLFSTKHVIKCKFFVCHWWDANRIGKYHDIHINIQNIGCLWSL